MWRPTCLTIMAVSSPAGTDGQDRSIDGVLVEDVADVLARGSAGCGDLLGARIRVLKECLVDGRDVESVGIPSGQRSQLVLGQSEGGLPGQWLVDAVQQRLPPMNQQPLSTIRNETRTPRQGSTPSFSEVSSILDRRESQKTRTRDGLIFRAAAHHFNGLSGSLLNPTPTHRRSESLDRTAEISRP